MAYLVLRAQATSKHGDTKMSATFLNAATTTLCHTISETEKSSYVVHINSYLADDKFLKKYIPLDPATDSLFNLIKYGVLLCKLINVAVPGTIDERAINTKTVLNPWERNENPTLCLNSAKAIGCTVVNIGAHDVVEGRPHLVLGLISQIIKIQLLADLNLKKTPQLVELVDGTQDLEDLISLPPEKILLRWMNFQLSKAGFKKQITNFSTDLKAPDESTLPASSCCIKKFRGKTIAISSYNTVAAPMEHTYSVIVEEIFDRNAELYDEEGKLGDVMIGQVINWPKPSVKPFRQ